MTDEKNIKVVGSHIYFYDEVNERSSFEFNYKIQELQTSLIDDRKDGDKKPIIKVHISSCGGNVMDGFAMMDTVNRINKKVKVHTYAEGIIASAATYMYLAGDKRYIQESCIVLVHQIKLFLHGKILEIEQEVKNGEILFSKVKKLYKDKLKKSAASITDERYWEADECIKNGFSHKII